MHFLSSSSSSLHIKKDLNTTTSWGENPSWVLPGSHVTVTAKKLLVGWQVLGHRHFPSIDSLPVLTEEPVVMASIGITADGPQTSAGP